MRERWESPQHRPEAVVGVGLIGEGPLASAYASALAQLRDVRLVTTPGSNGGPARFAPTAYEEAGALLDARSLASVVIVGGADAFALTREALLSGKHVLLCAPGALSGRQVRALKLLAESRSRLLLFGEERLLFPSVRFLRRMLAQGTGLWTPRYVRSSNVRVARRHEALSVASLAVEDLALCLYLLDRPVLSLSAVASPSPSGAAAVFLNVTFAGGVVAALHAGLAEAWESRQMVVALADKTLLLDEWDTRAPLKVISNGRGQSDGKSYRIQGLRERGSTAGGPLHAADAVVGPVWDQCRRFVEAVALGDLSKGNAEFWVRVVGLWEAAEASMAEGGAPIVVEPEDPEKSEARRSAPPLRLVHSGGSRRGSTLPRPSLTLVGG